MQLVESMRGEQVKVGSVMKGTGLYLAKRGSDNNFHLCCYNSKPVPFIMPDLSRRWDGVHWNLANFSQVDYPEPSTLRREEGDLSKCGTTPDTYD